MCVLLGTFVQTAPLCHLHVNLGLSILQTAAKRLLIVVRVRPASTVLVGKPPSLAHVLPDFTALAVLGSRHHWTEILVISVGKVGSALQEQ